MNADQERQARIKADPLASAADLLWLKERDPIAALVHPNCPLELWWELAAKYPVEAQASVLFPLIMLESPERWAMLEHKNLERWLNREADGLSLNAQRFFAADCAEHVLSCFEEQYPNDPRPRQTILVGRLYARGKATEAQWFAAQEAARSAAREVRGVLLAARYAALAASHDSVRFAVRDAAYAAKHTPLDSAINAIRTTPGDATLAAAFAATGNATMNAAQLTERRWQWERVKIYRQKEAPVPTPLAPVGWWRRLQQYLKGGAA